MKNFLNLFLDLIYKKKCYFCGKSVESLKMCSKCYDELLFSDLKINRVINGSNIYCAGVYDKNLQKLIRGLKYHKQRELAYYLAKFMSEYLNRLELNKNFVIIPIPLHENRIKKRHYNHMNLVAEELAKIMGWETDFELIKRIKDTKPQYNLKRLERMKNLENAFVVEQNNSLNKPLLIIDDICTTGSTFEEVIKTLKNKGFNDITCFAASSP